MHEITLLQFPAHEKAEANIDSGNGEPDSTHQKHFSHNDIWFENGTYSGILAEKLVTQYLSPTSILAEKLKSPNPQPVFLLKN